VTTHYALASRALTGSPIESSMIMRPTGMLARINMPRRLPLVTPNTRARVNYERPSGFPIVLFLSRYKLARYRLRGCIYGTGDKN